MKYPILYSSNETDFFSLGLGPLKNTIKATVTEERNGPFYLEAEILTDEAIFPLVLSDCIIKADAGHLLKDQRFRIKRIVPKHNGRAEIYAEHVSYLAEELTLRPEVSITGTASSALTAWKGAIVETNPFVVDSDISRTGNTKWRIDKVENPRQALGGPEGSLLDTYGGEYRFDNYRISLLQKRGTTANTVLAYGRNITDFEQERNIANTYTSIVPFAIHTDDNEQEITVTVDGYKVNSQYAGNYPNTRSLPVNFSDKFGHDEIPTKAKLQQLAEQYITDNEVGVPKTSIRVSFLDLSKSADYDKYKHLEEVNLCDDVRVVYPKLGVNTVAKVIRVMWNVLTESYDEIEIGEKRTTLATKINEQSKEIKEINNQTNYALISADGKNIIFYGLYGQDGLGEPTATKVGDSWYKPDGEFTELYIWNGTIWEFIMSTKENHEIRETIEAIEEEIVVMTGNIDTAVDNANQAVIDAGFATDTANTAHSLATSANQSAQDAVSQSSQAYSLAVQSATDASTALNTANNLLGRVEGAEGTIIDINSSIDYITGELEHKVSQTDYDTLTGRVDTAEGSITANATAITQKANQSSVDTLSGRVSTAEGQISVQAGQIAQRLTASQVETLVNGKGYATQASVNSQVSRIDGDINSWSSQLQTVDAKVDGIEIGGRNLIPSSFLSPSQAVSTEEFTLNGWAAQLINQNDTQSILSEGETYTLSYECELIERTDAPTLFSYQAGFLLYSQTGQMVSFYSGVRELGETKKVSVTFVCPPLDSNHRILFYTNRYTTNGVAPIGTDTIRFKNFKLEKGNKATDWTPAPEDLATVTQLTTNVNQINQSITDTNSSIQLLTQTVTQNGQDISSVSADLTVANGKITGLTSKTDGHTTQIGNLQSGYDGLNSLVTSVQTDLDGKVENTAFSSLEQLVTGIQATVEDKEDKTVVSQLASQWQTTTDLANGHTSQISSLGDMINLRVTKDEFNMRNLVPNGGGNPQTTDGWNGVKPVLSTHAFYRNGRENVFTITTSSTSEVYAGTPRFFVKPSTQYSLTFWGFASSNVSSSDVWLLSRPSGSNNDYTLATMLMGGFRLSHLWLEKRTLTFTTPSNVGAEAYLRFDHNGSTNGQSSLMGFTDITLVEGSTPADAYIPEVISQINLSPSTALIAASKVQITGDTYIANGVIKTAMIGDAQISGAKIANATISSAKIISLDASKITAGIVTGLVLASTSNTGRFRVEGQNAVFQNTSTNRRTEINETGVEIYNANGTLRAEFNQRAVNTGIVGTNTQNVYLGTGGTDGEFGEAGGGEVRVVSYNSTPGTGAVTDYVYRPVRAEGFVGNYVNVNTPFSSFNHLYLRPRLTVGEVRITGSGSITNYHPLRASRLYANVLEMNSSLTGSHLYLRPSSGGEVRMTESGTTNNYLPIRSSGAYGNFMEVNTGTHLYVRSAGEVRATANGSTSSYIPMRASNFINNSLAETKQDIVRHQDDALEMIKSATIYDYHLISERQRGVDKHHIGLVIGTGYSTPESVVDNGGVNQYAMTSLAWKAIQELDTKVVDEVQSLRNENIRLTGEISILRNEVESLRQLVA
jgi:phage minor structural protein